MKLLIITLLFVLTQAKINSNEQANVTLPSEGEYNIDDMVLLGDYLVTSAMGTNSASISVFNRLPKLSLKQTVQVLDEPCDSQLAIINSTSVLFVCEKQIFDSGISLTFLEYSIDSNGDMMAGRKIQYSNYSDYGFNFANDHFVGSKGGFYFLEGLNTNDQIGRLHRFDVDQFEDVIVIDAVEPLFKYGWEVEGVQYVSLSVMSDESAILFQAYSIIIKHTFETNKTEIALTNWGNAFGYIYALRLEQSSNVGVVFVGNFSAEIAEFWNFDTMERVGSPYNFNLCETSFADQVIQGQLVLSSVLQMGEPQVSSVSQISYTVSSGFQEWNQVHYNGTGATAFFGAVAATEQELYVVSVQTILSTVSSSVIEYQYSTDV